MPPRRPRRPRRPRKPIQQVRKENSEKFLSFCKELKVLLKTHHVTQLTGCTTCVNHERLYVGFKRKHDGIYRKFHVTTYGGRDFPKKFQIDFTEEQKFIVNEEPYVKTEEQIEGTRLYLSFLKAFHDLCLRHKVWSIYSSGGSREFLYIIFDWSRDNVFRYIHYMNKSNKSRHTDLFYYEEVDEKLKGMMKV